MIDITCLSIKQPWAWCIFNAGKNVENRTWRSNYRGLIMVHASKQVDIKAYEHLQEHQDYYGIKNLPTIDELKKQTGGFLGTVNMVSCRKNLPNNIWKQDELYGWIFENPTKLNFVPFKGKLSLFKVQLTNTLKIELGLSRACLNSNEGYSNNLHYAAK